LLEGREGGREGGGEGGWIIVIPMPEAINFVDGRRQKPFLKVLFLTVLVSFMQYFRQFVVKIKVKHFILILAFFHFLIIVEKNIEFVYRIYRIYRQQFFDKFDKLLFR
jgi:hypothetical protein